METTDKFLLERMNRYDRAGFGIVMRQVELQLLVHNNVDAAVRAVRHYAAKAAIETVDEGAWVCQCFPFRIAACLENAGYLTLSSVATASNEALMEIPNLGERGLRLIRETIRQIKAGNFAESYSDRELEPDWDLVIENTQLRMAIVPEQTTTPTREMTVIDALTKLLAAPEEAIEQLDQEIQATTDHLDELKRMRKVLAASQRKPNATQYDDQLEEKVRKLIETKGAMKPGAIANELGLAPISIGFLVKRSQSLVKRGALVALAN